MAGTPPFVLPTKLPVSTSPTQPPPVARPVPARGPDGYYRIATVAAPPPSSAVFTPSAQAPTIAAPAVAATTAGITEPRPAPSPATRVPSTEELQPKGDEGSGATNPVMGHRNVSSGSNRPSDGHMGGMDVGRVHGVSPRAGHGHGLHSGERRSISASSGSRVYASIPRSTTPPYSPPRRSGDPPRHGIDGWSSMRPVAPPVPMEMSTRRYRTSASFHPPNPTESYPSQSHRKDPSPGRQSGQERYPNPARRPSAPDNVASSSVGPHPKHRSTSHRAAPYPPREVAPAPPRPRPIAAPANAQAGPSRAPLDFEGDTIMRDAAEGLVQEQRRSLRGRAARSGLAAEGGDVVGGGGSEMSVIAGVSASGKGVRIGGSVKIGTGPGGVQRKKQRGDQNAPNQDFCSSCRGVGRFLCCDGCPRSFHFMCLEPPLRVDELPDEETWYCKKCRDDLANEAAPSGQHTLPSPSPHPTTASGPSSKPVLRPIPLMFRLLDKRLDEENPVQFRLPDNVRTYFAGVAQDALGGYLEETNNRKSDKKYDDRDIRIKEGARPVACYVCGGSNVPVRTLATDPEPAWRTIASCDYCALHWHLDCLSPPLTILPNGPGGKKWMCPNHAEQVMPRRRTIAAGVESVNVTDLATPNNGNIEVIPERRKPQLDVEDIMVNKRKYRVPERIIQLDFFDRVKGRTRPPPVEKRRRSGSDSSLTSLAEMSTSSTWDDMEAANLIIGLASAAAESRPIAEETSQPSTSTVVGESSSNGVARDGDIHIADSLDGDVGMAEPSLLPALIPSRAPVASASSDSNTTGTSTPQPAEPTPLFRPTAKSQALSSKPRVSGTKRASIPNGRSTPNDDTPPPARKPGRPAKTRASAGGNPASKGKGKEIPNGKTTISKPLLQPPSESGSGSSSGGGDSDSDSRSGSESEFDDAPGGRVRKSKPGPRGASIPPILPPPPTGPATIVPAKTPRAKKPIGYNRPAFSTPPGGPDAGPSTSNGGAPIVTPRGVYPEPPRIKLSVAKAMMRDAKAAVASGVDLKGGAGGSGVAGGKVKVKPLGSGKP